ncbi:MAG: hypothetical protein ACYC2I_00230 [Elusimicrobiales bacterium]
MKMLVFGHLILSAALAQGASAPTAAAAPAGRAEQGPAEAGHDLGGVTGTDISMKVYDHAVAGSINGGVAWGFFDEAAGASQLLLRKYGQTIKAEFKRGGDKSLGGTIVSGEGAARRETRVAFSSADPAAGKFTLTINGKPVPVSIASEGREGSHFVNPTYTAELDGRRVSYRVEAAGCMKYSLYMAMVILGAYAH